MSLDLLLLEDPLVYVLPSVDRALDDGPAADDPWLYDHRTEEYWCPACGATYSLAEAHLAGPDGHLEGCPYARS